MQTSSALKLLLLEENVWNNTPWILYKMYSNVGHKYNKHGAKAIRIEDYWICALKSKTLEEKQMEQQARAVVQWIA